MKTLKRFACSFLLFLAMASLCLAQNVPGTGPTTVAVQPATPYWTMIPGYATAAVNTQTTLTLSAPSPGLSIYVCSVYLTVAQDATATAGVNVVTTSTNFNSFALSYSIAATADLTSVYGFTWGAPASGCVKAAQPGTAVTFVSPSATTHTAFTWNATYYVAP